MNRQMHIVGKEGDRARLPPKNRKYVKRLVSDELRLARRADARDRPPLRPPLSRPSRLVLRLGHATTRRRVQASRTCSLSSPRAWVRPRHWAAGRVHAASGRPLALWMAALRGLAKRRGTWSAGRRYALCGRRCVLAVADGEGAVGDGVDDGLEMRDDGRR